MNSKVQAVHPLSLTIATSRCPGWCTTPRGHDSDPDNGDIETRIHTRDFGDTNLLLSTRAVASVAMTAAESIYRDGSQPTWYDEVEIELETYGAGLSGPQAREVARKLVAAADLWDEVSARVDALREGRDQ